MICTGSARAAMISLALRNWFLEDCHTTKTAGNYIKSEMLGQLGGQLMGRMKPECFSETFKSVPQQGFNKPVSHSASSRHIIKLHIHKIRSLIVLHSTNALYRYFLWSPQRIGACSAIRMRPLSAHMEAQAPSSIAVWASETSARVERRL